MTSGKILGPILTDCTKVAEQTNIELAKTHDTPNSTYVDVEVVPEAKSTSSENQTEFKATNSFFIQTETNINQVDADANEHQILAHNFQLCYALRMSVTSCGCYI